MFRFSPQRSTICATVILFNGFSRASVSRAIGLLRADGFLLQQPYGGITLTDLGRREAIKVRRRHDLLKYYLIHILLVPEEIAEEMSMPVERVREILKIAQEPVSLETPIGEEEDSHLGDFIPDEDASEPAEAASFTLLKEQLVDVLSTLTPREEKVLKLRFGIEDGRTRTLEEVGKEFNVTRERIRQIEAKALRKLRHPSRSKKLKDFLN